MSLDLNKIIEEIKKTKSIQEVKSVKGGDGKDIFDDEEKALFKNSLISKSQDKDEEARKVGQLLVRIKSALEKKVKNNSLLDDLETEKNLGTRGSITYRVLNVNGLVRKTTNYLSFLGRSDLPKNEDERTKKIEEYEKLIEKKRGERADEDTSVIPFEDELKAIADELVEEEETLKRREGLAKLLGGDLTKVKLPDSSGVEKLLTAHTLNNVKDYSTDLESTTPDVDNAFNLITKAYNYIDDSHATGFKSTASPDYPQWWEKAQWGDNKFNNRVWFSRNSLETASNSIGYGFLAALREIGVDKLSNIADKCGASTAQITKVKDYIKEVEACINWNEVILGKGKHVVKDKIKNWDEKFDEWQADLLKKTNKEYPYVPAVDWEHVFELMYTLFPVDNNGKLISKPYYDKNDTNFVKPTDETKGWSGIKIASYSGAPTGSNSTKTLGWYSNQSSTPAIIKSEIGTSLDVPKDWDFPSVVQLWWDVFYPFVNTSTLKWKKTNTETMVEFEQHNMKNEIRFCKTMREILLELGIASEENEFDDYLLAIAAMAEKSFSNKKYDRKALKSSFGGDETSSSSILALVGSKKFYAEGYKGNHKDYGKQLASLVSSSKSRVGYLKSREKGVNEQINQTSEKNFKLDREIEALKDKIRVLKELGDFEKKPLSGKKKDFNDLYNKKDSQDKKWTLVQIDQLLDYLRLIKSDMEAKNESDKYKSEKFEEKQTELEGVKKSIADDINNIGFEWEPYQNVTKNGLNSEAIKAILKDKGETEGKKKLERIAGFFKNVSDKIILSDEWKDVTTKLAEAIADPSKFKDAPTSNLTKETLTKLFKFDVDDALKSKWAIIVDGQTITESNINSIILKDYGPDNSDEHSKLLSHLVDKGDGFEGKDKAEYKNSTEDEKKASWKKLIEKGPKIVIETIVNHEFEDKKDDVRTEMEGKKNDDGQPLKDDVYKKGDDGKFDDDSVKRYMYEEKIGKAHDFLEKDKEENDDNGGDKNGKSESWFTGGFSGNWRPWVTYIGGGLLIIGVVSFIFWKQISEWWNGPAEEQGSTVEDSEEKDEENK